MHGLVHLHPSALQAGLALLCKDMHASSGSATARAVHKLQTTATGKPRSCAAHRFFTVQVTHRWVQ